MIEGGVAGTTTIKPVDKILIMNENVPWTHLPDGRPVPEPYQRPMRCRIYPTAFSCYPMLNGLTTMAMFGSFMGALMADYIYPDCLDKMAVSIAFIMGGLFLSVVIGLVMLLFIIYLVKSRAYLTNERLVLGRCIILTTTSSNALLYRMAYVVDAISMILFVVELSTLSRATEYCPDDTLAFYKITIVL